MGCVSGEALKEKGSSLAGAHSVFFFFFGYVFFFFFKYEVNKKNRDAL